MGKREIKNEARGLNKRWMCFHHLCFSFLNDEWQQQRRHDERIIAFLFTPSPKRSHETVEQRNVSFLFLSFSLSFCLIFFGFLTVSVSFTRMNSDGMFDLRGNTYDRAIVSIFSQYWGEKNMISQWRMWTNWRRKWERKREREREREGYVQCRWCQERVQPILWVRRNAWEGKWFLLFNETWEKEKERKK